MVVAFLPFNDQVADDDEAGKALVFSLHGILAGTILVIAFSATFLAIEVQ